VYGICLLVNFAPMDDGFLKLRKLPVFLFTNHKRFSKDMTSRFFFLFFLKYGKKSFFREFKKFPGNPVTRLPRFFHQRSQCSDTYQKATLTKLAKMYKTISDNDNSHAFK